MVLKIPRKIALKENAVFYHFFKLFWEKYSGDFPHVNPEHIIFVKDENYSVDPLKKYLEIQVLSAEERLYLPQFYFKLIVREAFNILDHKGREYAFYNCIYQIPRQYQTDLRLRRPDYVGFIAVMEKFKRTLAKNL